MSGPTGTYRVRRGFRGISILQQLYDCPSLIAGQVDSSVRDFVWYDVPFDRAPRELKINSIEDGQS